MVVGVGTIRASRWTNNLIGLRLRAPSTMLRMVPLPRNRVGG